MATEANRSSDRPTGIPIRTPNVEDSLEVCYAMAAFALAHANLSVECLASDGFQSVSLATQQEPDLVLEDPPLPDLSGLEAGCQIVAPLPSVQILIVSVRQAPHWREIYRQADFAGFVNRRRFGAELPPLLAKLFSDTNSSAPTRQTLHR